MNDVQVSIEGGYLVVKVPLKDPPVRSSSGKTLVVASTHGNQVTAATVGDKPVTIGLNAYIKP